MLVLLLCCLYGLMCSYSISWFFLKMAVDDWRIQRDMLMMASWDVNCLCMSSYLKESEMFFSPQKPASYRALLSTAAVYVDQYILWGCWQYALLKSAQSWHCFVSFCGCKNMQNTSDSAWIQNTNWHELYILWNAFLLWKKLNIYRKG